MKVSIVPHNPSWQRKFSAEAENLSAALNITLSLIHHIGSTAIPGILAKPIIDILIEVDEISSMDLESSAMETLGYEVMGEYGIPGRRYYRKNNEEGTRTHHVHVFETGSGQVIRHLAFRDYLVAHPFVAHEYSNLKERLVADCCGNSIDYVDGKNDFILDTEQLALVWRG